MATLNDLIGKTLISVQSRDNEAIVFETSEGRVYEMRHLQECCESVSIEDICGDLADLVGAPILRADEETSCNQTPQGVPAPHDPWYYTWTFYKFSTLKGSVTIRWYGESNGYYSESVDFCETTGNNE